MARRAPFIVCPCCVGKLAQRAKGTPKATPKGTPKATPKATSEASGDANGGGADALADAPPEGWNNGKGWVETAVGRADGRHAEGDGSLPNP